MVKKCLFPAAGYGTRFLPATKATPKEMLPVLTKPLIQYGVEEALEAGIKTMAIITGRGKRAIEMLGCLGGTEATRQQGHRQHRTTDPAHVTVSCPWRASGWPPDSPGWSGRTPRGARPRTGCSAGSV